MIGQIPCLGSLFKQRCFPLFKPSFGTSGKVFYNWAQESPKAGEANCQSSKVNQEVTPHVLRHTFATLALQKGISLATVKKILGHDQLSTTEIYLNFTNVHIQEEYENKW